MQMGNSNLENALELRAFGLKGFVPEGFKAIVAGIPVTLVELLHSFQQAGVADQTRLANQGIQAIQRLAGLRAGSLRNRIESGVTSSISSGPMYSRARSRVIWRGA